MRILVTGGTGLVGSALVPELTQRGHEVVRLAHAETGQAAGLVGIEAVIHLAGENIASGRWTPVKKSRIRDSRVLGTGLLARSLSRLEPPPRVMVSASAVGFYGNRGDETLTEASPVGSGFLAQLCRDWEAATEPARSRGLRIVFLRFGVILSPRGGALAKMLPPFRFGLGGWMGDGRQFLSWIAIDDVVGVIQHVMNGDLRGPVNAVAPVPVTAREFAKTLGRVLGRPALLAMPALAARLALGEMAKEVLLASQRAEPRLLVASGYPFLYPTLEPALRHLLLQ